MAETTYEKMSDAELARLVAELERRVAEAGGGKAKDAGSQGRQGMSLAEAENELNQARAVLSARKLGQGLP